ncbi:MAG TPA: SgcJ/EcaC family oxidoreductase [Gemmatimonadaceae bacterium]|nr:SgcJ/EcaC family oxidoreductase [Gemmatimonadaceae bacterium]
MRAGILMGLCGVALVVTAGCKAPGAAAGDSAKPAAASAPVDEAAVRKAVAAADSEFAVAFNAGDAAKAASFYTDDAVSRPPNAEPQSGKAAIEQGLGGMFKGLGKVNDFKLEQKDLDVFADHAIEIGSYSFSFTPAGAKAAMKDHGSYVNYWKKQADGSWKIYRDAIVSSEPLPGQAPTPPTKKS